MWSAAGTGFRSGIVRVRLNQAVIGLFGAGEQHSNGHVYSEDGTNNNNCYSVYACTRAKTRTALPFFFFAFHRKVDHL